MKFTTKILAAAAAAFVGVVALSAYDARPKLSAGFQAKSGLTKTVTRQVSKMNPAGLAKVTWASMLFSSSWITLWPNRLYDFSLSSYFWVLSPDHEAQLV